MGCPSGFDALDQPVSIGITTCQQNFKEQHQGGPDRRRAPKPGQNELPDHGLDLKQQESGKKNTEGK
jgi:hypothetical protein